MLYTYSHQPPLEGGGSSEMREGLASRRRWREGGGRESLGTEVGDATSTVSHNDMGHKRGGEKGGASDTRESENEHELQQPREQGKGRGRDGDTQ